MKKLIPVFILLFSLTKASACLNYFYSTDKEGHLHLIGEDLRKKFNINFNAELTESRLIKLEAKLKTEGAYMLLSDYALGLMKLGKTSEAQQLLAEIYKHYPNDYKIASNLGTAYELIGKNDSALKYIKRGLQLNPNDHEGSEWVHVKILETKIKLGNNPSYLKSNTVLGLSPEKEKDSTVWRQILIQAHERFPFTKGPDAIMASIMTDLGDCLATSKTLEYALSSYLIAKEYYGDKSDALESKIKETKDLLKKYKDVRPNQEELSKVDERGMHQKMKPFGYKIMLDDNDQPKYKVNWNKINTDVNKLLAMANLSLSEKNVKDAAFKNNTDELKFVKDSTDKRLNKPDSARTEINQGHKTEESKGVNWMMISLSGSLAIILLAVAFRKKKKK